VTFAVSKSPRAQRRLRWAAGLLALGAALTVLAVALPKGGSFPDTSRPGRPEIVRTPHAVPLTAERRAVINRLLDKFVPAAVERRDPLRALPLVTDAFRAGISRTAWAGGKLPVVPYDAAGAHFHGWTLDYSLAREMSVDVLLRPGAHEKRGAIAFTAVFKRPHRNWLIDAFIPAASFAPDNAPTKRILAQPDFAPMAKPGG
jgi:hypothetical protein